MERWRGLKMGGALLGGWMFAMLLGSSGCGLLEGKKEETAAKKPVGQECAKDADCESGSCATVGGVCSKSCVYDRECGDGLVCRAKETGGMQCTKAVGAKVGSSCTKAAECDHGSCVRKAYAPDAPGFCSRTCQGSEDCADGYRICESISEGDATKLCLQGDDKIPIGERPKYAAPIVGTPTTKGTASATPTTPAPVVDAGAPPADAGSPPKDAGPPAADAGGRPKIEIPTGPLPTRPKIDLTKKK